MLQNMSSKFFFYAIDLEKKDEFIKKFVEFNSFLNEDDGVYLINESKDIFVPSYSNSIISKYPFKQNKLKSLINDCVSVIKELDDTQVEMYLLIFTEKQFDLNQLEKLKSIYNFKFIVSNEFDINYIIKEIESTIWN